jgi:hypothetical protein
MDDPTIGTRLVLNCKANHHVGDLTRYGTSAVNTLDEIAFIYGGQPSKLTDFIDAGNKPPGHLFGMR